MYEKTSLPFICKQTKYCTDKTLIIASREKLNSNYCLPWISFYFNPMIWPTPAHQFLQRSTNTAVRILVTRVRPRLHLDLLIQQPNRANLLDLYSIRIVQQLQYIRKNYCAFHRFLYVTFWTIRTVSHLKVEKILYVLNVSNNFMLGRLIRPKAL